MEKMDLLPPADETLKTDFDYLHSSIFPVTSTSSETTSIPAAGIDLQNLQKIGEKCAEIYYNQNDGEISYFCLLCSNKFHSGNLLEQHLLGIHYLKQQNWDKKSLEENQTGNEGRSVTVEQKKINSEHKSLLSIKIESDADDVGNHLHDIDNESNAEDSGSEFNPEEELKKCQKQKMKTENKKFNKHSIEKAVKKPRAKRPLVRPCIEIEINGEVRYQCVDCLKHFGTRIYLRRHERLSHSGRVHVCEQCGKALRTWDTYKNHLRIHSDEKPYKCDICGKQFRSQPQLLNHKVIHSNVKKFQCDYCEARFHTTAHKRLHERTHTGEKPYQCHTCGHSFSCTSALKTHTKRHLNDRAHVCEICSNRFILKQDLRDHMRSHSNEREFVCDICKASYKGKRDLRQHLKVHQDLKEYRCKICGIEYARYKQMYNHIKNNHGASAPVKGNVIHTPVDGIVNKKGGRPPIKMFSHLKMDVGNNETKIEMDSNKDLIETRDSINENVMHFS